MEKVTQVSRTIWPAAHNSDIIQIIDQRHLPHELVIADLTSSKEMAVAIQDMWVRGAPLIGAAAAYGMYLAAKEAAETEDPQTSFDQKTAMMLDTRPTAVNLHYAVAKMRKELSLHDDWKEKIKVAETTAAEITEDEVRFCKAIGEYGLTLIQNLYERHQRPINILTHCNAGWLACVEWGTATSPIYHAHEAGIPVHVWVDETRPRNQGAALTAWELAQKGVPHTVIADNTGGHLMQHGQVDICFVGSDRTTRCGDVANKIGTYLKALAAHDNGVPFYVALPSSTIDFTLGDGVKEIPIEQRSAEEVTHIRGWSENLKRQEWVRLTPADSPAANYAFDVTPARLVSGLITERGICEASEDGVKQLFGDKLP